MQTLHFRRGKLVRSGAGLSLWFRPLVSSVAEVPLDDRDLDFHFLGRSADFQSIIVQGVITFRVVSAETLARRIDFSIDLASGVWLRSPIEKLQSTVTQLAQQVVWDYLSKTDLRTLLAEGVEESRQRISAALESEQQLADIGISIVAVRVSGLSPSAETEKALEMPTRERIQEEADEATFRRRAQAVENERAIQENELQNQIELARREEQLVTQQGANHRRLAEEEAAAARIAATSEAEQTRITATAAATRIQLVDGAAAGIEKDRAELLSGLTPIATLALVARDAAGLVPPVSQLVISPDLLATLAAKLSSPAGANGDAK
jgi:regulator of protease activity HflC (stomatin/prohibitin superfamily)